ncbi:glycosyltransferase [Undibacterium sp. SXout20W]|uniref:glycosyltransferase n=1 Tax=Undibacterium sp. SXout20W TaxID=3413051 RepID=UPI003BF110FF
MISVSVCICTFRRPEMLRRLLTAVFSQELPGAQLNVVVVDNDHLQSASVVLAEMVKAYPDRLKCLALSESNISLARNAAIRSATGEWICMVDDDECPDVDWLAHLFKTQQQYQADVIFAPVIPEYAPGVPAWVINGGYFDRRRLPTGTLIDDKNARSGNVLVRRKLLDQVMPSGKAGPFDPAFGKSGGEDSMLFRALGSVGAKMVWCDEAPVTEVVPVERATASWLLQRSFRTGQLFMRTELAMFSGYHVWTRGAWLAIRAIVQMIIAFVLTIVLGVFAPLKAFYWARLGFSQLGKLNHFRGVVAHVYGDK